jgi:hypothetical protein
MLRHMRTTVRLDDELLNRAKREAMRRKVTLTALIEQGLRMVLARTSGVKQRARVQLPTCHAGGGLLPGVDLNDSGHVLDRMEGRA